MKETEALVRIQEIDLALMRSKSKLDNMPQAKKRLAVAAARKKLAGEISKIVGIRKDADMDLEENEASHRRAEEQVEEIQEKYASGEAGYRELADLESRLSTLAKRMEKLEFKHILIEIQNLRTALALFLHSDLEHLLGIVDADHIIARP